MFTEDDLISAYSRTRAIEDGVLVDVTDIARGTGIRIPTALTSAAYDAVIDDIEAWDDPFGLERATALEECLAAFVDLIRSGRAAGREDATTVPLRLARWAGPDRRHLDLKVVCGPDDDGAPCLTVMLPNED